MTGQIARRVIEAFRTPAPKGVEDAQLTARENEILELLAKGHANKEIAGYLKCSTGAVRSHLQSIYEKLHMHCRTEAAAKYLGDPLWRREPRAPGSDQARPPAAPSA